MSATAVNEIQNYVTEALPVVMVTGSAGLIGLALKQFVEQTLPKLNPHSHLAPPNCAWVFLDRSDADLTDESQTRAVFAKHRPTYVIHLAVFAVGGPAMGVCCDRLLKVNHAINHNVVSCARDFGVKRFVGALTHYAYPEETAQPMSEEHLHKGTVISTAAGYAAPKRHLDELVRKVRSETGAAFFNIALPCVYGPTGPKSKDGPVVGALISKCYSAKKEGRKFVVQGTGQAVRQFLYSRDVPSLLLQALFGFEETLVNFPGTRLTIKELAREVASAFGMLDRLVFDDSYPEGPSVRLLDTFKFEKLSPNVSLTPVKLAIRETVEQYIASHGSCDLGHNRKSNTVGRVAVITGIAGQDGSYMAELLLSKGYIVHGLTRRTSNLSTYSRIQHLLGHPCIFVHQIDVDDQSGLSSLFKKILPTEVYHLAAQSDVRISFDTPLTTTAVNSLGTLHVLEALRCSNLAEHTRFYQASTSELYGKVQSIPQNESTPFYPRSPYAVSKLGAFWTVVNYREAYNMFACNGILFNHESPRRGDNFVTRKITRGVAKIKAGLVDCMYLGNLNAKRDWGHARDYVKAMWLILQHTAATDFVVGSGCARTVREFCEAAFQSAGLPIQWENKGTEEVGILTSTRQVVVRIDPQLFRPAEVDLLLSDPSHIGAVLGWTMETSFEQLVEEMVKSDINMIQAQLQLKASGNEVL